MVEIKLNLGGLGSAAQHRHGPLGIPPSIRQGSRRPIAPPQKPGMVGKRGRGHSNLVVEQVLKQGKEKEKGITDMLNELLKAGIKEGTMPEFDRLNEQLGQVQQVIKNALARLGGTR